MIWISYRIFLQCLAVKSVVTSKGQVTIPKALREKFGIEPGAGEFRCHSLHPFSLGPTS